MASALGPIHEVTPDGDNRKRLVCRDCGFINYVNPKVIVGAVCTWQDQILLCRRAIEPRMGYWTVPAGYLELYEGAEQGAAREALEEAGVHITIDGLLAVYSLSHISQIQLIYRAYLKDPYLNPGPESSEARLVDWSHIPWNAIAFPSVTWALNRHNEVRDQTTLVPATQPNNTSAIINP